MRQHISMAGWRTGQTSGLSTHKGKGLHGAGLSSSTEVVIIRSSSFGIICISEKIPRMSFKYVGFLNTSGIAFLKSPKDLCLTSETYDAKWGNDALVLQWRN